MEAENDWSDQMPVDLSLGNRVNKDDIERTKRLRWLYGYPMATREGPSLGIWKSSLAKNGFWVYPGPLFPLADRSKSPTIERLAGCFATPCQRISDLINVQITVP